MINATFLFEYFNLKVMCQFFFRLASLVGITERETGVGKLGWHRNSAEFDRKYFVFPILRNKRKKRKIS